MFGFHFSPLNYAITSGNISDSLNLLWNQQMEGLRFNSIMNMVPNFNPSFGFNYSNSTVCNELLNPMLAAKQVMQGFQNYNWMNNSSIFCGMNNFGNFQFPGFIPTIGTTPSNSTETDTSNMTDAEKVEYKKKDKEYNALKAFINSYKNIAEANGDTSMKEEIDVALNNTGACPSDASEEEKKLKPVDRKLRALKELYKKLDKTKMRKAMASLSLSENNYKGELKNAGYNFGMKEYSYGNAEDADFKSKIDRIHQELGKISASNYSTSEYAGLIEPMATSGENDILRIISYWNDKYNGANDKGIIRLIASKLPNDKKKETIEKNVKPLVNALTAKANTIKDNSKIFDEKTLKALDTQITNVNKALEKACDKNSLEKLATEFDKLYVILRKLEAHRINHDMKEKYGFLNDIATDDVDFINNDIIIKETKEDLKAENMGSVTVNIAVDDDATASYDDDSAKKDADKTSDKATDKKTSTVDTEATGEMEELAEQQGLTETDVTGYYQKGKQFFKYNPDTQSFERLEGVTKINANGTMVKKGKTEKIREVEPAEESGKVLRQRLVGETKTSDYTIIAKKMNSFETYTDAEDIVKFVQGYNNEKSWWILADSKLCAQIATESGMTEATKITYLKSIAKKMIIVAKKAGFSNNSEEITTLREFANKGKLEFSTGDYIKQGLNGIFAGGFAKGLTLDARKLDSMIDNILKKYNGNATDSSDSTEATKS